MQPEHGNCPACGVSLDGGGIWDHFFKQTGDEAEADRIASVYGATRTTGQWDRKIGIYDTMKDRTVAWRCPDCYYERER